jgi:hypothetical protein
MTTAFSSKWRAVTSLDHSIRVHSVCIRCSYCTTEVAAVGFTRQDPPCTGSSMEHRRCQNAMAHRCLFVACIAYHRMIRAVLDAVTKTAWWQCEMQRDARIHLMPGSMAEVTIDTVGRVGVQEPMLLMNSGGNSIYHGSQVRLGSL